MLDANVDSLMYVLCGIDLALCCIIIIGGKYWVWLCCFYCSAQNCETPDYGMNTIIPVVTVPQIQIHVNSQSQREQRGGAVSSGGTNSYTCTVYTSTLYISTVYKSTLYSVQCYSVTQQSPTNTKSNRNLMEIN